MSLQNLKIPTPTPNESPSAKSLISSLSLTPHPEGGYFIRTHTNPLTIPSPFPGQVGETRPLSTSIFYLLTPHSPIGHFHKNRSLIVHTAVRGRGRYVLVHESGKVETFVVGCDVEKGDVAQWVVEGGVWKGSMLGEGVGELLITEVAVPGFDFSDHEFMAKGRLADIVGLEAAEELSPMLRSEDQGLISS
ncbi:hypothetical protein L873DRAFT_1700509 [Choiromyces venosus 120613-1]|uniref:DUF985 domain-containing protein n=1 Tax=Choiromyces venosus 120613-1 TaxID=1336337 RepID=A0A3N4J8S0_9PEZI|nr:hypothetical protein L873DRAFT_1700509 [Choiromyces venosus 120613-1]